MEESLNVLQSTHSFAEVYVVTVIWIYVIILNKSM